ncbi:oxidation resistance protein 1 [Mortierella claussenii]|nr:oxidation resistance protein 1 [Mortierella claussenii]
MIPRKAKQAVLSLVTTEQPKYGPSRSTQSTVSGGDWGEPVSSAQSGDDLYQQQQHTHGFEPNSTTFGQDPWMMVTGSGSSYVGGSGSLGNLQSAAPLSSSSTSSGLTSSMSTPMMAREEQLSRLPPLQLLDRYEDTDPVLDPEIAHQIRLELPRKLRNATKWNLVYSSDQHGISMTTLYHRCRGKGPMIMAIKDSAGCVFGAFVTEELKPNLSYYGTGECFLWNVTTLASSPLVPASPALGPSPLPSPSPLRLSTPQIGRSPSPGLSNNGNSNENRRHDLYIAMNDRLGVGEGRSPSPLSISPQRQQLGSSPSGSPTLRPAVGTASSTISPTTASGITPPSSGRRKRKQKVVQFWKWSGKNDYMVLSELGFIGFGGGDGKFGLWIHSDLEIGHSARCATFDNEPLAAACRHPITLGVNGEKQRVPAKTGEAQRSRSSSPKDDKEEFYCQTVEIWSMVL